MPKRKTKFDFLNRASAAEKREMEITSPIMELSKEEMKIIQEVKNKLPDVEERLKKAIEEQKTSENQKALKELISLMKFIIKTFELKSVQTLPILREAIVMYKNKNDRNEDQSKLTEVQDPLQNQGETSLFKKQLELAAVQLKSVKKIQQNHSEHLQAAEQGNNSSNFSIRPEDLLEVKLKKTKEQNPKSLNKKEEPSELEQKFAKRREMSEGNNKDAKGKSEEISCTTNISPDEQRKLSERTTVEMQLEQKNTQNENEQSSFVNTNDENYKKATQIFENLRLDLKEDLKEDFENLEFDLAEKHSENQLSDQAVGKIICQLTKLSSEKPAKNSKEQSDAQFEPSTNRLSMIGQENVNTTDLKFSDQAQNSDASNDTKSTSAEFDEIDVITQESMRQLEAICQKQYEDLVSEDSKDKKIKLSKNRTSPTVFKTSADSADIENKNPVVGVQLKLG